VYTVRLNLNNGHDLCDIEATRDYGDAVEIKFMGRDPTSVSVRLTEVDDVRAIGQALIRAADGFDYRDYVEGCRAKERAEGSFISEYLFDEWLKEGKPK
jgi:hypothetical protein